MASTRWRLNISAVNGSWAGLATLTMAATPGGPNLCTGGTASVSGSLGGSAANVFDSDKTTYWVGGGPPAWVEYTFAAPVTITSYGVQCDDGASWTPKAWTLEYWNGSAWVVADTQSDQINWYRSETRTFPLVSQQRWRLHVTASAAGSYTMVAAVELRLVAGGANQATVPGQASASYDSQGHAERAADGNASTHWGTGGAFPHWWQYWCSAPTAVVEYVIRAGESFNSDYAPKDWTLEYWNLTEWVVADTRTNQTGWTSGQARTFTVPAAPVGGSEGRVTQAVVEVVSLPLFPASLVTQVVVEVLGNDPVPPPARVTQAVVETLSLPILPASQVTQLAVEVVSILLVVPDVPVPNVVGLTQAAAETAITAAGFTVGTITTATHATVPAGTVISQAPTAGTLATPGTPVAIVVSLGPPLPVIPDVVGLLLPDATAAITAAGFTVGTTTYVSAPTVLGDTVVSQAPVGGTSAAGGTAVALSLSLGSPALVGGTQVPVEIVSQSTVVLADVTQVPVEVITQITTVTIDLAQVPVEVITQIATVTVEVTQVAVEVAYPFTCVGPPCPGTNFPVDVVPAGGSCSAPLLP